MFSYVSLEFCASSAHFTIVELLTEFLIFIFVDDTNGRLLRSPFGNILDHVNPKGIERL